MVHAPKVNQGYPGTMEREMGHFTFTFERAALLRTGSTSVSDCP